MSLIALRRHFEARRLQLISMLQTQQLQLGEQHQAYGAIKEIENFLRSIDAHIEASNANDFALHGREDAEERRSFLENVYAALSDGKRAIIGPKIERKL